MLRFTHIHHQFNKTPTLRDINLVADAGEITCLLGASGCGKTTLLNLAAGILPVQQGEIELDGKIMATAAINPPPEKRPVGLVFQDGALFPHMDVAQNVSFGIKDSKKKRVRVQKLLQQIGLSGFEKRFPHSLSGGQQQRVALARALASQPKVLLLDEPFANIDIMLRRQLREETRMMLKRQDCAAILVTHDPEEAMLMGDKIAVMSGGEIVQFGSAADIYNSPASLEVALLTGQGQVIDATVSAERVATAFGDFSRDVIGADLPSGAAKLLMRPGQVNIDKAVEGGIITDIRDLGRHLLITIEAQNQRVTVDVPRATPVEIGETVALKATEKLLAF